jgi:alkylation response protein AidB-like acyl-CoA dehydrogenase
VPQRPSATPRSIEVITVDDDLNDDQRMLLDASTRFLEQTCPLGRVRDGAHDDAGFAAAYRHQAAELGWFSLLVPEPLGGGSASGNGVVDAALVAYRRGRLLQPGPFIGTNVVADALARAGSDEQQSKVLPELLSGEAGASWVPAGLPGAALLAEPSDGGYRLSGRAAFVEDPGPNGWLLLTAEGQNGLSQLLVRVGQHGVEVARTESLDLSRRFVELRLDGAELPASSLVGGHGGAAKLVDRQLALACVLTAAESVGAMDHELQMTVQYAKDRIAFGRPIGSFQAIKHLLADTSLNLEMSKAIALAAAVHVGEDDGYGLESASMAKAFVGDCGIDLAQACFQVFGGIGFTWEHDQHLYLRRLTTSAALFGDPTWHRERLCRLAGV